MFPSSQSPADHSFRSDPKLPGRFSRSVACMQTGETRGPSGIALETADALAGRRFALCGFDANEGLRIGSLLREAGAHAVPAEEGRLAGDALDCDAILVKLLALKPEEWKAATASVAPVLLSGPSQALFHQAVGFGRWPGDFLVEPWLDAELLVRLSRLVHAPGSVHLLDRRGSRSEPLALLADDDPDFVLFLETTLRRGGLSCQAAGTGLACLRMARELAPDIIILDINMPQMNGFEALRTIRCDPSLEAIPVVLLTGCDDPVDIVRASELHANEYLAKPVDPNVLLTRTRRLIASYNGHLKRRGRVSQDPPGHAEWYVHRTFSTEHL